MERYKNNLLLDMGRLQGEMQANRESVFFLLRADRALKAETQDLVVKLHTWPRRLDEHLAACDDRHLQERATLEGEVSKTRAAFDVDAAGLRSTIAESLHYMVTHWSDTQSSRTKIDQIHQYQKQLLEF